MSEQYERLTEARLSMELLEAKREIERLRSLIAAKDELLACYRLGRGASDALLDRIKTLKAAGGDNA